MILRKVDAGGSSSSGASVNHAVLDHVGFDGSNTGKGPAGLIVPLIANRGKVVVGAAVVAGGDGCSDGIGTLTPQIRICQSAAADCGDGSKALMGNLLAALFGFACSVCCIAKRRKRTENHEPGVGQCGCLFQTLFHLDRSFQLDEIGISGSRHRTVAGAMQGFRIN